MIDLSFTVYAWTRVVHVVVASAWIGGLVGAVELAALFAAGEGEVWLDRCAALLRRLVMPASGLTLLSGAALLLNYGEWAEGWLHAKLTLVAGLLVYQGVLTFEVRRLGAGAAPRAPRRYRSLKVFPIFLFIGIVALVMVRPF